MRYKYVVLSELASLRMEQGINTHYGMVDEVKEVYRKAKAFDEIVAEFGHYVDTLPSWESIDHKDTQTLLEIIKENIGGE